MREIREIVMKSKLTKLTYFTI